MLENSAGTAMERSNLHGFLAAIFRQEVTKELLQQLKSPQFQDALSVAGVNLDADFLQGPEERLLEDLAVEYTALFLGPGGHISPHESVQIEPGSGLLWGPSTAEVRNFIEAAGFRYDPDFHGIPDHVSVELEFMKELTRLESVAWEKGNPDEARNCLEFQQEFLSTHLCRWIYTFCRKVEATAELPFYVEMARLTAAFIEAEEAEVQSRMELR